MNPTLFPDGVDVLVNEKCPNLVFVDSLSGISITTEELEQISATDQMTPSLRHYYLNQHQRSILTEKDLDLLVMDSYSDMNFELWELPERNKKLWVHPKFIRTDTALSKALKRIGRCSLDEAVSHVVAVIDHVRELNPGLPVLFLPQPIDFYPKLASRREFSQLGPRVAAVRAGVFAADALSRENLEPDDLGSCGPGQTLHFTVETYRKMVGDAWARGLKDHFNGTTAARDEVAASPRPAIGLNHPRLPQGRIPEKAAGHLAKGRSRFHEIFIYAKTLGSPVLIARWFFRRVTYRALASLGIAGQGTSSPTGCSTPFSKADPRSIARTSAPVESPPSPPADGPLLRVRISFNRDFLNCSEPCQSAVARALVTYKDYFSFPLIENATKKRYTPMLIALDKIPAFPAWEEEIKRFGKGARLRQKNKAKRLGYLFRQFAWAQFIPDIHEINHSKEIRSGGVMRGAYQRSIDEMGGAPQKPVTIVPPACPRHWSASFGVFLPKLGHCQGSVEVNEQLVAYIVLQRTGEVLLYSMILGHGEHLANGVLVMLHHELVAWAVSQRENLTKGVRYLMYGGRENGGASLLQWKRQAGFRPHLVDGFE